MRTPKIGLLASHPIQYLSPLLRELARRSDLHVYYAHRQTAEEQGAAGYGVAFDWDTDLLGGYRSEFLRNTARQPDVNRFDGCDCPDLPEVIARGRFDAFIVAGWYLLAYLQAAAACRRMGVPVIVRGDSQLQTPRSTLKRLAKELVTRVIIGQFDAFLAVGQRNRAYLEHYGAPPHRIFPAPHFIDNSSFGARSNPSPAERQATRATFGARDDDFVVLFVGRLLPFKRPLDLVQAAAMLRDRMPRLRLVFVGAGALESEIAQRTAELGVNASLIGFRNQSALPPLYAAADLLALPSDGHETWGLVVNEAFSCGLPAVVSDAVGSAPDLIVESETGTTYPCGDVEKLAEAIERMALLRSRRDLRPHLDRVVRRHSCEAATIGTLAAVHAIAGKEMG